MSCCFYCVPVLLVRTSTPVGLLKSRKFDLPNRPIVLFLSLSREWWPRKLFALIQILRSSSWRGTPAIVGIYILNQTKTIIMNLMMMMMITRNLLRSLLLLKWDLSGCCCLPTEAGTMAERWVCRDLAPSGQRAINQLLHHLICLWRADNSQQLKTTATTEGLPTSSLGYFVSLAHSTSVGGYLTSSGHHHTPSRVRGKVISYSQMALRMSTPRQATPLTNPTTDWLSGPLNGQLQTTIGRPR